MKGTVIFRHQSRLLLSVVAGLAITALAATPASAAGGKSITFRTYDVPGHQGPFIEGINNEGDLSGQVIDTGSSRGFVTRNGVATVFDYPGTTGVTVWASISDNDIVTGQYVDSNSVLHSFTRSSRGVFTAIDDPSAGTASGQGTAASSINDVGVVSGSYTDSGFVSHGFLEGNGAFTTIDVPGAGTAAGQGTSIGNTTNAGVITGTYTDSANVEHDFVDDHGRLTTFNVPGFTLIDMTSNNGHVTAGASFGTDLVGHGFLLMGSELTKFSEPHANHVAFEGTYAVAMDLQGDEVAGGYWDLSGTVHGWIGAL
jgi:hypothetical protein